MNIKRNTFIIILLLVIFCILYVYCFENAQQTEQPSTSTQENNSDDYNEEPIVNDKEEYMEVCDSKIKLAKWIGKDVSNVEITDIQYKYDIIEEIGEYTNLYIFYNETKESLHNDEFYFRDDYIPPGIMKKLKKMGIKKSDIQEHGYSHMDYKVKDFNISEQIYWYRLGDSQNNKHTILLIAPVPHKILLDVDKIMNE